MKHPYAPVVLAVALLTAACGGGSTKDVAPTKAAATSAASAINLVAADLSGYTGTPHDSSSDSDDTAVDKQLATCLGVSDVQDKDDIVDVNSDDFTKGEQPNQTEASSEVEIVPSTAKAKSQLKAFSSSKATTCLESVFTAAFKKEATAEPDVTISAPKVSSIGGPSGTDGSFGFSIALTIKDKTISLPVQLSIIGFLEKHTEVTLMTSAFTTSFADQDKLVSTLVSRAKKSAV